MNSIFPQKKLFDLAILVRGVTYDKEDQRLNETTNIVLTADNITLDGRLEITKQIYIDDNKAFSDDCRLKTNDIFICMSSGSKKHVGKVAFIDTDTNFYAGGFMGIIRTINSECMPKYLYYILNTATFQKTLSGESAGSNINNLSNKIGTVKIPVPAVDIQEQIIDKCSKIDKDYNSTRMSIQTYRKKIEDLFSELDIISSEGSRLSLANPDKFNVSIGKRVLNKQLDTTGTVPVYSANVVEPFGYTDKLLITDFSVPSILWGIDGDWMTNYMPENTEFYPTDHCGILRCKTSEVNPRYMAHILEKEGKKIGFSRSYRASIDRVQGITFTVPDINVQNEAMKKVLELEHKISDAEKELAESSKKKERIVRDLLN